MMIGKNGKIAQSEEYRLLTLALDASDKATVDYTSTKKDESATAEYKEKFNKIIGQVVGNKKLYGTHFDTAVSEIKLAYLTNFGEDLKLDNFTDESAIENTIVSTNGPETSSDDGQPVLYVQQPAAADNVYVQGDLPTDPDAREAELANELGELGDGFESSITDTESEDTTLGDEILNGMGIIPEDIPIEEAIPEDLEESDQPVYPSAEPQDIPVEEADPSVLDPVSVQVSRPKRKRTLKQILGMEQEIAEELSDLQEKLDDDDKIYDAMQEIVKRYPNGLDKKQFSNELGKSYGIVLAPYETSEYASKLTEDGKLIREKRGISNVWLINPETVNPEEAFIAEITDNFSNSFAINEAEVAAIGNKYNIPEAEVRKFILQTQKITSGMLLSGDNDGLTGEKIREAYNNRDVLIDEFSADGAITALAKYAEKFEETEETLGKATVALREKKKTQQQLRDEMGALKAKNEEMTQEYQVKEAQLNTLTEELEKQRNEKEMLSKKLNALSTVVASAPDNLDHVPSTYVSAMSRQAYMKLLGIAPQIVENTFTSTWAVYPALKEYTANLLGIENGVIVEEPDLESLEMLLDGVDGDAALPGLRKIRLDPNFPAKAIGKKVDAFITYAETLKELKENEQVIKNE